MKKTVKEDSGLQKRETINSPEEKGKVSRDAFSSMPGAGGAPITHSGHSLNVQRKKQRAAVKGFSD